MNDFWMVRRQGRLRVRLLEHACACVNFCFIVCVND